MVTDVERANLRITVRPSPGTNDHEVLLVAGEQNLVERFAAGSMGLDPDDLLVEPCTLLADGSSECLIGRCDCGVLGCGDVRINLSVQGDTVIWADIREPRRVIQFERQLYQAEVERSLADFSWETAGRRTERLIRNDIDRQRLADLGFEFSWASTRASPDAVTIALWRRPGREQVLVSVPLLDAVDPESAAAAIVALMAGPPSSWPTR
jgi:hypothetical protein